MAERQLPKLNVAGSIPVSRSNISTLTQPIDYIATPIYSPYILLIDAPSNNFLP